MPCAFFLATVVLAEDLNLTGTLATGYYRSESNIITRDCAIEQDNHVWLLAGAKISPGSGFHTATGSTLHPMIGGCEDLQ